METMYRCCAGLDVHKETVEAHLRRMEADGKLWQQTRRWGTMFHMPRIHQQDREPPLQNVIDRLPVNSRRLHRYVGHSFSSQPLGHRLQLPRQVPGQKTDVKDCQWIAQLLQHGLLGGSFVPPRGQRELRERTRHRTQLVGEKTRIANRITRHWESRKIASYVTSGRRLGFFPGEGGALGWGRGRSRRCRWRSQLKRC